MSIDLTGDLFANYASAAPPARYRCRECGAIALDATISCSGPGCPGGIRRARNSDPETSHEAAEAVDRFASGHYALIVEALRALGRAGAEQIAGRTRLDAYQIRKRLPELERAGIVTVVDATRYTATGRRERIWVLT